MRVALFVNGFPEASRPHYCVYNLRTAVQLARRVDLTVIVPRAWRPRRSPFSEEPGDGFRLLRLAALMLPGGSPLNVRLFHRAAQHALRALFESVDVVHSVGLEFAGLVAARVLQEAPRPHVAQMISDPTRLESRSIASYPYLEALRARVDAVLCNSVALTDVARELLPGAPIIRAAYRGTDLELFRAGGAQPVRPGDPAGTRFLYLGGLPPYPDRAFGANTKGGVTLMDAWREAESELVQRGATLVFGGPESDSRAVRAWRSSLASPEAVSVVGRVSPETVREFLCSSDVVLVPSLEEGCPNLAFEALASGRMLLGSDIGPLLELLGDSGCGESVPAGDVAAWATVLGRWAGSDRRPEIEECGRSARRRAESHFDSRQYARSLEALYIEICEGPTWQGSLQGRGGVG